MRRNDEQAEFLKHEASCLAMDLALARAAEAQALERVVALGRDAQLSDVRMGYEAEPADMQKAFERALELREARVQTDDAEVAFRNAWTRLVNHPSGDA